MSRIAIGIESLNWAVAARGRLLDRLARDRRGSTAIEYAITIAGIGLGGGGLTSVLGVDIAAVFGALDFEFCLQAARVCVEK